MIERQCNHCEGIYEAQRKSSKFCSDACRVASYRGDKDSKGAKLAKLMDESDKLSRLMWRTLSQAKYGKKDAWEKLEKQQRENTRIIQEIANLLAT